MKCELRLCKPAFDMSKEPFSKGHNLGFLSVVHLSLVIKVDHTSSHRSVHAVADVIIFVKWHSTN